MTTNFNTNPYFDDYNESKNFHRVLFKPGVSVQARELTQLQTILQNQISRFGRHFFKEGSMVIPGGISVDTNVGYVTVASTYNSVQVDTYLEDFLGTEVSNAAGVKGTVIAVEGVSGSDPITLFVKYTDSGDTFVGTEFSVSDVITSSAGASVAATVTGVGIGSVASISEGVYFILGSFIRVAPQTIVLDKYSNTPTYRIGLLTDERLISSADDETLLDNANGTPNFAAPGADRYAITLTLTKIEVDSVLDQDFIELARIENGELKLFVTTTDYSIFERTLARRTYDESGDYTVRKFQIQPRESRDNNRGDWITGTQYLIGDVVSYNSTIYVAKSNFTSVNNPSVDTTNWRADSRPFYNNGVYTPSNGGNEANLAIGLEPGKAYVRGFEIEKIATEYLDVPKARDFVSVSDDILNTNIGNYVIVKNLDGIVDSTQFSTVTLYDRLTATPNSPSGNAVGNARVRYFEHHNGTPGTADCEYKFSLFDVRMDDGKTFERNVKQIYGVNSGAANVTADISPVTITLSGSITASGTAVTGTGTLFLSELVVGDYISANSTIRRVTAITNDNALTVDSSLTATGAVFSRVQTQFLETDKIGLLFRLPYTNIKETSSRTFTTVQRYDVNTDGSGNATITTATTRIGDTTPATSFSTVLDNTDYVIIRKDTGAVANPTINVTSGQINLSGLAASQGYSVYVPGFKSGTQSDVKTKTLVSNATKTFTIEEAKNVTLSLGKADIYRIVSILDENGTDLYDWYNLDDGQRSTHYDLGRIVRKPGYPNPSANVTATFDYFTHSAGDHFAKESYVNIRPEDIPVFVLENGSVVRLSDVLDFRPRINDAGTGFTGTGASLTQMPYRTSETQLDYAYYLGRIDKIALNEDGQFFRIAGTPSLNPAAPDDSSIAMTLYTIKLHPYTYNERDIQVFFVDNKRYTMRDIGRLEQRIKNVEYYTSLSLLEQDTKNLSIRDSFGLDRFKNGFIVDNFTGHSVGDVWQPDYRCSIDMQNQTLRPQFRQDNIKLIPVSNVNIRFTGDIATLPYTDVVMVDQPYASRVENINPYSVFTFIGSTELNPKSDEWFEVERRPDIVNETGNYDSIMAQAEQIGLGTVWNNWETSWSGVRTNQQETTTSLRSFAVFNSLSREEQRRIATGPSGTVIGIDSERVGTQSRSGVTTSVNVLDEVKTVDDKVVSTSIIPFIRSRHILFRTHGLKPNTKFFAYFDNVSVNQFITPATKIVINSVSGTFNYQTHAGVNADVPARRFEDNTQTAYDRGDVITQASTGATAIVAYVDGTTLYVVNVKGTFNTVNTITGSISGATAQPVSVSVGSTGGDIVSSLSGDVVGVFIIPNTDALRFRTGSREFKLSTSNTLSVEPTSLSTARYEATGLLETRQATITSVRNAEIVQRDVFESRTLRWVDPLAQTFLVQQDGGAFLTKVDIFFQTKSENLPVTLQIREVVNGYPGQRVLPFSSVVKRASDIVTSANGTVATTFTFDSPVYVQNGTEYAIVLLSDSNEYFVWISQVGETDVASTRTISDQPYMGSLFKSQNASTWTAEQMQDLKFRLYRASFTALEGTVTFANDKVSSVVLNSNPIQTANGLNKVRIFHPNHNLVDGDNVLISGAITGNIIANVDINGEHTVSNVLLDSFVITTANAATATSRTGGTNIVIDRNMAFDVINPFIQQQNFAATTTTFEAEAVVQSTGTPGTFELQANQNRFMDEPRVIWSETNEDGTKSFGLTATLRSTQENLSPVIDLSRCSLVTVRNRIDCPLFLSSLGAYNVAVLDDRSVVTSNATIGFVGNTIYSNDATVKTALRTLNVGRKIAVSGTTGNNKEFVVSGVDTVSGNVTVVEALATEAPGASVTIVSKENYVDEIAPSGGSSSAKYIMRKIQFTNPSTYLKVMMALNSPNECGVDVYYKTTTTTSGKTMDEINWTKMTPTVPIVKTSDSRVFTDVDYEVENLPQFNVVAIKIVMRALNSSVIPAIKDLRVIGCA